MADWKALTGPSDLSGPCQWLILPDVEYLNARLTSAGSQPDMADWKALTGPSDRSGPWLKLRRPGATVRVL